MGARKSRYDKGRKPLKSTAYGGAGVTATVLPADRLKAFFRLGVLPPAPRRLDGRSTALLAASFEMLPDEEPGWITMKEVVALFSPERDAYAFGELDEIAKANLAAFASATGVQFEFMPVEGRLYFLRKRRHEAFLHG
jgi:hypothetical protein